ncbi:hypothetical protein [Ralstonia phage phiRSL1]|uniref:Uncharacterized protein n=1 Tax=Ralstonia phage phiRSL1 TaxID=1980924 RepID=B2ZXU2_9CAUD|nr:hypothetical protein RSL1_ORF072 [Ralstonia phage phiRSL1]BAG41518.1 hypothetical protein [Ralstonia phage phiRSL1]
MAQKGPGIKYEGHWYSSFEPWWPSPTTSDWPWTGQSAFLNKLERVESTLDPVAYRGISRCRVCGEGNGCEEFNLEGWRWPSGFRHYIEQHNVKPSSEFIAMIVEQHARILQSR